MLRRGGVSVVANLRLFGALAAIAMAITYWFGDAIQWICLALGLYVVGTLAQRLAAREPETHALLFRTPSLRWATLGFSFLSINGYAMGFSIPEFFVRYHGFSRSEIGSLWGLISAVGGGLGVAMGGYLSDRFKARTPSGRLMVGMMNALLPLPFLLPALNVTDGTLALGLIAGAQFFAAMWLGAGVSTVQDLVLPRMRARASAVFLLFVNLISLALGPYVVGRLSDHWGSLRMALMVAASANLVAFVLFLLATRTIGQDEATREERAAGART
jgi:predicted MFS family arabinose efflux permease